MDLLSAVGLATKRRADLFAQAKKLAAKTKDEEKLEEFMKLQAKVLVKGLRDKQMRWEEYERTLTDKTLVTALAAVYLGAGESQPSQKMEKAWPTIVGDMLPPLLKFLEETKYNLDNGNLLLGDKTVDFEEFSFDEIAPPDEVIQGDGTTPEEQEWLDQPTPPAATRPRPMGWGSLLNRVIRYIANPAYSFFNAGQALVRQEQGYREMRRVDRGDGRVCQDCRRYTSQGWQPIGTLPMPGRECRCYDRCRCRVEYR
jgi:hypothetical protein